VNRFVIYEPAADRVELVGSFTDWQRTPMEPVGESGYWELHLRLPTGEHRFAYILDGARQMADPTLPVRERDDFGGENSILSVGEKV
jgi:1,4-alpha-glucan branching enzyme